MRPMSSVDIDSWAKKLGLDLQKTTSRELVNLVSKKPVILNMADLLERGTHWVAYQYNTPPYGPRVLRPIRATRT